MTSLITLPSSATVFIPENKTFQQWLDCVKFHRQLFIENSANSWLIYDDNAYEFSVLFFALLTAHKKIVLPQNGTANQLKTCLEQVEGFTGSKDVSYSNCVYFDADGMNNNQDLLTIPSNNEIILFTSGSSGKPKAIFKEFSHLLREVLQLESTFGEHVGDSCFVSTVSHQHIYGLLFKVMWPIWTGRKVVLQPYEYPEHLCHDLKKYGLNKVSLISSPAHFHRLVKDNVYIEQTDCFTSMFSSGGPLSQEASSTLVTQMEESPFEIFGSTETGGIGWRQRTLEQHPEWTVFDNIEIAHDLQSQCLKIKSPYIAGSSWYVCDDQVEIHNKTTFELCGRIDRVVKIEEKRVSLDHVQQCIKNLDFVDDAYCLTAKNKRGTQVVAVVILTELAKNELAESRNLVFNRKISTMLQKDLETIAIPKRFRYLEALPYNSSGKLNKNEMEKCFE